VFQKLVKALEPEGRLEEGGGGLDRLRTLAAIGVVVASVCSAIAVLVGAVYDEHGSQEDAVYRQKMVAGQQLERLRDEDTAADVALFGGYEQHILRARDLRRDAASVEARSRLANALRTRAEGQLAVATALLAHFRVRPGQTTSGSGLSYDPSVAYRVRGHSAAALEETLAPGEHRRDARGARLDGVSMAFTAMLFLAALLLFTTAQVYARIKTPEKAPQAPEPGAAVPEPSPKVSKSVLYRAYLPLVTGALVWLFAFLSGLHTAL